MSNKIIEDALKQENEDRHTEQVAHAQEIIRGISQCRERILTAQVRMAKLQKELREFAFAELLADSVLGE